MPHPPCQFVARTGNKTLVGPLGGPGICGEESIGFISCKQGNVAVCQEHGDLIETTFQPNSATT